MKKCGYFPARWIVAIHCFFVFFFFYSIRLSFSVAIVCMVRSPVTNGSVDTHTYVSLNSSNFTDLDVEVAARNQTSGGCEDLSSGPATSIEDGEFEWSKATQAELLSAVSYGYITTQILGGWMARRYGTRRVLGLSMVLMTLCCILTPVSARVSTSLLFAVRVICGMAMGVCIPAVFNISGRWAPPLERSLLMSVSNSGFALGYIGGFLISGLLCQYGFDGGWPSVFYVFGALASVWLVFWFLMVYDTPGQHPRISAEERDYIKASLETSGVCDDDRRSATPWCSIVTSLTFWGNICAYLADDWVNYTLQLGLVVYMKEVLKYDIAQNGLFSSLPPLGTFIAGFLAGYLADLVQKKQWLSTINARRLFQLVSFVPMGIFLIVTGFVTCENRVWAIVFLTAARIVYAFCKGGFVVNAMDFAPRYCGEIVGILNTVGTIPGFLAPLAIGYLTPNGTQEEWQNVFGLAGGVSIVGAIGFCLFASAEVQTWARPPDQELVVRANMVTRSNEKDEKEFEEIREKDSVLQPLTLSQDATKC